MTIPTNVNPATNNKNRWITIKFSRNGSVEGGSSSTVVKVAGDFCFGDDDNLDEDLSAFRDRDEDLRFFR